MAFFGLTGEDEKIARSYVAYMTRSGRSRADIAADIQGFIREYGDRPLELEPLVRWADQKWGREVVTHMAGWFDTIAEHGVESIELEPPPSPERVAEAERLMRENPEAYARDAWAAQDLMDAVEAQQQNETAAAVVQEGQPTSEDGASATNVPTPGLSSDGGGEQ